MDLSLAPSLNGWSAGRWLPQLEVDTCSFDFASIPDPLRLRHEGVVIRRNEDAPEDAVSDWCDRAHQSLQLILRESGSGRSRCFRSCLHSRRRSQQDAQADLPGVP